MKKPLYTTAAQQDLVAILRYISQDKPIGGVSPLEHIVTEPGAAEVQNLIGQIEYGLLS